MTPTQKIKHAILLTAMISIPTQDQPITADNVDALYDENGSEGRLQDAASEVRGGQFMTDIKAPWSRHYESKSVATQMPDGSWVGWSYWYGGGKYSEPEAINWMDDAYDLTCVEEVKTVTVKTFSRAEAA